MDSWVHILLMALSSILFSGCLTQSMEIAWEHRILVCLVHVSGPMNTASFSVVERLKEILWIGAVLSGSVLRSRLAGTSWQPGQKWKHILDFIQVAQLLCTIQLRDCLGTAGPMKEVGKGVPAVRMNSCCSLPNHFKAQMQQHTTPSGCDFITNNYRMCQINSSFNAKWDLITSCVLP